MDFEDTYVPIFRSLITHRYMSDPHKLQFWIWCLLKASHKQHRVLVGNQTVTLEVGQFVFGRKKAAEELGISEQNVRTLVNFFSSDKEQKLTIKSTNKFSIITVIKYNSYMVKSKQANQQSNQHLTSNQPAPNHKQEGKEGKERKDKNTCPEQSSGPSFLLNDGSLYHIPEKKLAEWVKLYEYADVEKELQKLKEWCEVNPKRRKTRDGALRFCCSWLNKADNSVRGKYEGRDNLLNMEIERVIRGC